MSATFGERLRVTVFGQSHSEAMGAVVDGLPAGLRIDTEHLRAFLARRVAIDYSLRPRGGALIIYQIAAVDKGGWKAEERKRTRDQGGRNDGIALQRLPGAPVCTDCVFK